MDDFIATTPFSGGREGHESIQAQRSGPLITGVVPKLRELANDIKLHHSVFALPWALLATFLAAHRSGGLKIGQLILILIAMVTARTVAMVANRLLDAEFDAANPRTARRAVPSRRLSSVYMWTALAACGVLFIAAAAGFLLLYHNPWPITLSIPVLAFLIGYSLMKRYTRFSHYYLGASLALAPICAWIAIVGGLSVPPLLMAGSVLFWTAGFDILYACQDYDFDVKHGLFSVPAKVGITRALWIARATHVICAALMILLFVGTPELKIFFGVGMLLTFALLATEHWLVKADNLSRLNLAFFTINGTISLLLGGLGILDILLQR